MDSLKPTFLDTHAAVLLWSGRIEAFGSASTELLELAPLKVSPLVALEITYLREIGRLEANADRLLGDLESDLGVEVVDENLGKIVGKARLLSWTRDPFDRLLVATAQAHDAPFITRDRLIREHYSAAVW